MGQQSGRAAMVEQIRELWRLGRGIDRAKHGASLQGSENADDRLPAVLEEQQHAVPALHAAARQGSAEAIGEGVELSVGEPLAPGRQSDLFGKSPGAVLEESLYPHAHVLRRAFARARLPAPPPQACAARSRRSPGSN